MAMNKVMKIKSDMDRVLLFLYVKDVGLPSWGDEVYVFAKMMGWPMERARAAFEECFNRGLASKDGEEIRNE